MHSTAFDVVEYPAPVTQAAQTTLALAVHNEDTYWPLAHVPQVVQEAALEVVEYEVPATQSTHTALAVAVHALLRRVPAAQTAQVAGAVTPARQKLVPAVHVPVIPADGLAQKLPAGQVWHTVSEAAVHEACLNWPALHTLQGVHDDAFGMAEYPVPVAQAVQTASAAAVHAVLT